MANYKGSRLVDGESISKEFDGFIDKGNGIFRKPRLWVNKSGKECQANSYYRLTKCYVCEKKMLQNEANRSKKNKSICSSECLKKIRMKPDGNKKFKRATKDSHVLIKASNHPSRDRNGYIPEHRLVMEQKLGRYLKKGEIVHHINLIKSDNRIENLVLFDCDRDHFLAHGTLNKCVAELMSIGVLKYNAEGNFYHVDIRN